MNANEATKKIRKISTETADKKKNIQAVLDRNKIARDETAAAAEDYKTAGDFQGFLKTKEALMRLEAEKEFYEAQMHSLSNGVITETEMVEMTRAIDAAFDKKLATLREKLCDGIVLLAKQAQELVNEANEADSICAEAHALAGIPEGSVMRHAIDAGSIYHWISQPGRGGTFLTTKGGQIDSFVKGGK